MHHGQHLFNIMHPHQMRAIYNAQRRSRRRGHQQALGRGLRQERLARRAGQYRQIDLVQRTEVGKQPGILFLALAEAQTGIDDHACHLDTTLARAMHGRLEIMERDSHRIRHGWKLRPSLRRAPHVVQYDAGIVG